MIEPVAKSLAISKSNIVANTIFFDEDTPHGEYKGFCRDEPTSADMGKPKAVQLIKDKHGYKTIVMVGDGATDAHQSSGPSVSASPAPWSPGVRFTRQTQRELARASASGTDNTEPTHSA